MSRMPLSIVCAWCDRVRTSGGRWEKRESPEPGPVEATHGICPDCLAEEQHAACLDAPQPLSLTPAGARLLS
ncbi:MAG TPA: hypothetical protein VLF95_03970 [Vicinamibacteria bacterium]|nr:hypothetical protein [Vicinamibacteria bacterium]